MSGRGHPHLLVLDEDARLLVLLRTRLTDGGYRVTTSRTPLAVQEVASLAPDLVVLDLVFGGALHGQRLLQDLRQEPSTAALPVVLCTAAVEAVRTLGGKLLGPTIGLALKPVDPADVLTEVRRLGAAVGCEGEGGREQARPLLRHHRTVPSGR